MADVADGTGVVVLGRLATDPPVTEPEGFRSILNSALPRKRAISQLLVRDTTGRVLLCHLTYKRDWDLPGGVVEVGESPRAASGREIEEELALTIEPGRLLLTDWLPPWGGWDDAVCLVFDGGVHDPAILDAMVKEPREIQTAEFCSPDQVLERAADFTAAACSRRWTPPGPARPPTPSPAADPVDEPPGLPPNPGRQATPTVDNQRPPVVEQRGLDSARPPKRDQSRPQSTPSRDPGRPHTQATRSADRESEYPVASEDFDDGPVDHDAEHAARPRHRRVVRTGAHGQNAVRDGERHPSHRRERRIDRGIPPDIDHALDLAYDIQRRWRPGHQDLSVPSQQVRQAGDPSPARERVRHVTHPVHQARPPIGIEEGRGGVQRSVANRLQSPTTSRSPSARTHA